MAIKGKTKSRSKKAVTAGPKPVYVPVKKRLLARRGVQIGLVVVLVIGSAFGIWYGLHKEHTQAASKSLKTRERTAVGIYQGTVDRALQGVGQPVPGGFSALSGLKTNLDDLKSGKVSSRDALKAGKQAEQSAHVAWQAIDGFNVATSIGGHGFPFDLVYPALNSRTKMVDALKLYEAVAVMLQNAAQASGTARDDLIASAQSTLDVATGLFADGYNDYKTAQAAAGIFAPTFPQQPTIPGAPATP